MKEMIYCFSAVALTLALTFQGGAKAASWTCYDAGEGSTFCSSAVLDLAVYGAGFSTASQCAAFCNPY
jgi:hypothetical protein